MSRIGKQVIALPKGVTCTFAGSKVSVKGPKGELHQVLSPEFKITQEDGHISVHRPSDEKSHKSLQDRKSVV